MKNKSYLKRGGAFALAITIAASCFLMSAQAQQNFIPAQGVYIDGTTNTITITSSNCPVALVLPGENRFFNLTGATGQQDNTNLWPTVDFTLGRAQGIGGDTFIWSTVFNTAASKASNVVFRLAGSVDGAHWLTNPCPYVITVAQANASLVGTGSVFSPHMPFIKLWNIDARNCDAITSNLWMNAVTIP
jgi:hypothetical protein